MLQKSKSNSSMSMLTSLLKSLNFFSISKYTLGVKVFGSSLMTLDLCKFFKICLSNIANPLYPIFLRKWLDSFGPRPLMLLIIYNLKDSLSLNDIWYHWWNTRDTVKILLNWASQIAQWNNTGTDCAPSSRQAGKAPPNHSTGAFLQGSGAVLTFHQW